MSLILLVTITFHTFHTNVLAIKWGQSQKPQLSLNKVIVQVVQESQDITMLMIWMLLLHQVRQIFGANNVAITVQAKLHKLSTGEQTKYIDYNMHAATTLNTKSNTTKQLYIQPKATPVTWGFLHNSHHVWQNFLIQKIVLSKSFLPFWNMLWIK